MPILDHFTLIAPFYDRFLQAKAPEKLKTLLGLPVNGKLLDVGGGTGRVSEALFDLVNQAFVLDLSPGMLSQASRKEGLRPVRSESERLPFPDCTFERIIMVDALHHVASQVKTAGELWRVLKPGGLIVIEEPDIHMLAVRLIAMAEKLLLMRSHFLTPGKISRLFDDRLANIKIETDGTTSWVIVEKP
jgi:demethylmenaquinone methyltransferase/2-methoxy-6-polyprenyl-1,4-benzoquinol methylase